MTFDEITQQFQLCKNWEDRYRLLIRFSRLLPKPSETELLKMTEISGCESRLWFHFQKTPREVQSYSEARLMQGILFILNTRLQECSDEQIAAFDVQAVCNELQIAKHLTSTRLNGLKNIESLVRCG